MLNIFLKLNCIFHYILPNLSSFVFLKKWRGEGTVCTLRYLWGYLEKQQLCQHL